MLESASGSHAARPRAAPSAQPGAAQPRAAQPHTARPRAAQAHTARPRAAHSAQPGAAQPRAAQPHTARPRAAQAHTARPRAAQLRTARRGTAPRSTAAHCKESHARHSPAQPGAAQPRAAQPQLQGHARTALKLQVVDCAGRGSAARVGLCRACALHVLEAGGRMFGNTPPGSGCVWRQALLNKNSRHGSTMCGSAAARCTTSGFSTESVAAPHAWSQMPTQCPAARFRFANMPHRVNTVGVRRLATVAVGQRAGAQRACRVVQLRSAERESLRRPACQACQFPNPAPRC